MVVGVYRDESGMRKSFPGPVPMYPLPGCRTTLRWQEQKMNYFYCAFVEWFYLLRKKNATKKFHNSLTLLNFTDKEKYTGSKWSKRDRFRHWTLSSPGQRSRPSLHLSLQDEFLRASAYLLYVSQGNYISPKIIPNNSLKRVSKLHLMKKVQLTLEQCEG